MSNRTSPFDQRLAVWEGALRLLLRPIVEGLPAPVRRKAPSDTFAAGILEVILGLEGSFGSLLLRLSPERAVELARLARTVFTSPHLKTWLVAHQFSPAIDPLQLLDTSCLRAVRLAEQAGSVTPAWAGAFANGYAAMLRAEESRESENGGSNFASY